MLKFLSILLSLTLAIASQAADTLSFTPIIRADGSKVTNVYGTNINISFGSAGVTNADGSITVTAGSGSGSVTSVGLTGPAGSTVTGSPITGSGTLALTFPSLIVTQNFNQPLIISNNVGIDAAHWLSLSNFTAGRPLFLNSDNTVTQWIIGSGLTLSGNTISATGGGSVTSVAVSSPLFTVSGTPITTSGTIAIGATTDTPQFAAVGIGIAAASSGYLSPANVVLSNNVAATSSVQKQSPSLRLIGNGWDTVAGASKPLEFSNTVVTVSTAGSPIGTNITSVSQNNAAAVIVHQEDYVGNEIFAGDITLGTSGGSHRLTITGPHGNNGWQMGSDSPSTLSSQFNASSHAFLINSANGISIVAHGLNPGANGTLDLGQGGGATARWRNVVMSGAVTNDINGQGTGASISIPDGGGIASNTGGNDMNIIGSQATGTARSGAIMIRTAPTFQGSGSTVNSLVVRSYLSPKRVNLTETTATIVFNVSLASGKWCSLHVFASTQADDGTDRQVDSDEFLVSAVNKAGTVTTGISTIGVATSSSVATGASTLTTAWTAVANGNGVDIKNNATSSLVQTTLASYWRVEIDTDDTALAITPQ